MSTNEADARSPFDKLHSIMQSYGVGDGWADEDPAGYAQFLAEIDTMYADACAQALKDEYNRGYANAQDHLIERKTQES